AQMFTEQGIMRSSYIGKQAAELAAVVGIEVPADTKLLIAPLHEVGAGHPLSLIKPGPILALYKSQDDEHALLLAEQLLEWGAAQHSAVIHCNDPTVTEKFANQLQVNRLIINAPA